MRYFNSLTLILTSVLILASCSDSLVSDNASEDSQFVVAASPDALAKKGGNDTPFNGSGSGTTTTFFVGDPDVTYTSDSNGTLIGNKIGNATYSIIAAQDWNDATFGDGGTPCAHSSGDVTITAADGSEVFGTFGGEFNTCETGDPGTFTSTLVIEITGGTGRFEGASGTMTSEGTSVCAAEAGPDDCDPLGALFNDTSTWTGSINFNKK